MICLRPLDGEYDWSARCQLRPGTQPQPPAEATDALSCMGLSMGTLSWHCVVRHSSTRDGPRGVQEARVLPTMELRNYSLRHSASSYVGRATRSLASLPRATRSLCMRSGVRPS